MTLPAFVNQINAQGYLTIFTRAVLVICLIIPCSTLQTR